MEMKRERGNDSSESMAREVQVLETLNLQLTANLADVRLKVLRLETENTCHLQTIARLTDENRSLRKRLGRRSTPEFLSPQLDEQSDCACKNINTELRQKTILHCCKEDTNGIVKPQFPARYSLTQTPAQRDHVSSIKFIREVGGGLNGKVCLVEVDGLHCVAKTPQVPPPTTATRKRPSLDVLANFDRELSVLPRLCHPNIIQYIGVHSDEKTPAFTTLIMEYLPVDLDDLLLASQGCFPLPLQLSVLMDVSLGMQYLHSRGVVHCDLTPDNILLTSSLRAKIGDLGCSKPLGTSDPTGYSKGMGPYFRTYMPPEVLEPNFLYTEKLDVFTYGVLALYVTTQRFPVRWMGGEVSREARERGEEELERRGEGLSALGEDHCLASLIRECLQDEGESRISPRDITCCLRSWLKVHPKRLEHVLALTSVIRDRLVAM